MVCLCKDSYQYLIRSKLRQMSSSFTRYTELDPALSLELEKIIETISAPRKGLLACDESPASLEDRFQEIGIDNTESTRHAYREMLLSADKVAACDGSRNFRSRQGCNAINSTCSFVISSSNT